MVSPPWLRPFLALRMGGRIMVSDRSSGRLIGGNYPPGSSPIRSRLGLTGSFDCNHSSRFGKYHQFFFYIPPKDTALQPQRSQETTFIGFPSVAGPSVACRNSRVFYAHRTPTITPPPTRPGCGTFVVLPSSTTRTSLEYCNLQHNS